MCIGENKDMGTLLGHSDYSGCGSDSDGFLCAGTDVLAAIELEGNTDLGRLIGISTLGIIYAYICP
jgi:hypothetical protein